MTRSQEILGTAKLGAPLTVPDVPVAGPAAGGAAVAILLGMHALSAALASATPPAARNARRSTSLEPNPLIRVIRWACDDANRWIAGRRRRWTKPPVRERLDPPTPGR